MDLKRYLAPISVERFFASYWQRAFVATGGDVDRAAMLSEGLPLDEPWLLWQIPGAFGGAWASDSTRPSRPLEPITVDVAGARSLYERGYTISATVPRHSLPAVDSVLRSLEHEVGTMPGSGIIVIISAPKGASTRFHFDATDDFMMMLKGSERWWLTPNEQAPRPLEGYYGKMSSAMSWYANGPMPKTLPKTAKRVRLMPGSALYFPHGYWHQIRVLEASVALNLKFPTFAWSHFIGDVIQKHLSRFPHWRRVAAGAWGGPRAPNAEADLQALLAQLPVDLASLSLDDLRQPSPSEQVLDKLTAKTWLMRAPSARWCVEAQDGGSLTIRIPGFNRSDKRLYVPKQALQLFRQLEEMNEPFGWGGFSPKGISRSDADQVVCDLVQAGFLRLVAKQR